MITTHVLDTSKGQPADGIAAVLEFKEGDQWKEVGKGATDSDGRIGELVSGGSSLEVGSYRLTFQTSDYFKSDPHFYPVVSIQFSISAPNEHYHVPLLLSPFGYSTYRGS